MICIFPDYIPWRSGLRSAVIFSNLCYICKPFPPNISEAYDLFKTGISTDIYLCKAYICDYYF